MKDKYTDEELITLIGLIQNSLTNEKDIKVLDEAIYRIYTYKSKINSLNEKIALSFNRY